ncbi:VWA domain-containing protein [Clostridium sp. YIM B02505]|uniref:VWA domain-containing protein n=1 Tax=Clostridium yunnanense TaxID=2800325 RepID=A0ABS1EQX9_9CLOT|nr:VWA domain-containing protein [Clostridium yunnanense]MBK1811801.1 VWA domain-containing protein [Clostridium yunnanense]
MGFSFIRPYLLLFIPILIGIIIFLSKYAVRINKSKRKWAVILRSIVITLIMLSICGTSFYWKLNNNTTIFLIDNSDSVNADKVSFETFVKDAVKEKSSKDQIGVLSFGGNTQVESFISKESNFSRIDGNVDKNYTDIESALASAIALFPSNSNKRIVLLSDGDENQGDLNKIMPSIKQQGIELEYYKKEKDKSEEIAVQSISVPEKLVLDEEFNLSVNIQSTTDTNAKLSLFNGREKVGEQSVHLTKGINKYVFRDKATTGGFKGYKVTVEADKDKELKNNEASAFTMITSKPKILIIDGGENEAGELTKMLTASSLDFTVVNAKSAPRSLQEMTTYKSIITCNVSADDLNEGFMNSLESYVKDFGGGFIATGGDNSFALGGYSKTSLEKVLPVYMDMRGKKEIPKMAMMLIIDKSGSMTEGLAGVSKVDMAKEAAIRSLDSLRTGKDEIGVLTFDGEYSWAVKRGVINDSKKIEDDIGSIRAGGGTSILPALEAGYKSLKESDAKIKHIILLTDGQAERTGYDNLLKDINKDNITVSTVAVGRDADKNLLKGIADFCGGRSYVTDEYTNIPRIFSKETFMAARMYLNNREFTPKISTEHSIISGVADGGLPSLLGYIGSSQKETARMILKSDEDDPILTVWQYGLGKAVAWNSDISGKWSANYIGWGKNLKLWQNIINFSIENYNDEDVSMEVSNDGNGAKVVLKDKKNQGEVDTTATIVNPQGESKDIKLYPTAPGEYTGNFQTKEDGVYMISAKQSKSGETLSSVNSGYARQYSPEYKIREEGNKTDKIITENGGKIIKTSEEVFSTEIIKKKGQRDLSVFLLALALIILMFDIALRRLNLNLSKIKLFIDKLFKALTSNRIKFNKTNKLKNLGSVVAGSDKDTDLKEMSVNKSTHKNNRSNIDGANKPETYNNEFIDLNPPKASEVKKVLEDNKEKIDENKSSTLNTSQLLKNKRFKK